jgi:hypothetical protein
MPQSHGADLQVSGNWFRRIDPADLEAGAGTDFISPLYATGISPSLTISNTDGTGWTLAARLVDSGLPAGVSVGVRANSGEGINCGATSLTLSSSDQTLCTGTGDRAGIALELRLQGVSNAQPPGGYGATVQYRVY